MNNLKEIVDGLEITVDQEFLDFVEEQTWPTSAKNGHDYLLLEHYLIKEGHATNPDEDNIVYDFEFEGRLYDVKTLSDNLYFHNIEFKKIDWWQEAIDAKDITHFLFVRRSINGKQDSRSKLKLGDVVSFEYLSIHGAQHIVHHIRKSHFKNYYVHSFVTTKDGFVEDTTVSKKQTELKEGDKVIMRDDDGFSTLIFDGMTSSHYGRWYIAGNLVKGNFNGMFHYNASQNYYYYEPMEALDEE